MSQIEVPENLRLKILSYYEQNKQVLLELTQQKSSQRRYLMIPIMIDGVFDFIRYDTKEQRFDQITVAIATGDITTSDMLPDGVAYSDKVEFTEIYL